MIRSGRNIGVSCLLVLGGVHPASAAGRHNVILFVPDGLRADIVTPATAPVMAAVRDRGVDFRNPHSLFPTFTMPNASGMATPDDLEEFRACQMSYQASAARWNDMSRGAAHWIEGADEAAASIGLKPLLSGLKTEDEGLFVIQHRQWQQAMKTALSSK